MALASEIVERWPNFLALGEPAIDSAIARATALCPEVVWGELQHEGVLLLTAHLLLLDVMQSAEIAAASTGIASGQTASFSGTGSAEEDYMRTTYGRQWLNYKRSLIATGFAF
ncbi:MAG TPA: DUF4054 domain-containing protein [Allocoleopsis sp.]